MVKEGYFNDENGDGYLTFDELCEGFRRVGIVVNEEEFKENFDGKVSKKKNCNKKFCFDCLEKHFPLHWNTRLSKDWKCPCCTADCNCSQCRKLVMKEKKETESILLTCESNSNLSDGKQGKKYYNDKTTSSCFKEEFLNSDKQVS